MRFHGPAHMVRGAERRGASRAAPCAARCGGGPGARPPPAAAAAPAGAASSARPDAVGLRRRHALGERAHLTGAQAALAGAHRDRGVALEQLGGVEALGDRDLDVLDRDVLAEADVAARRRSGAPARRAADSVDAARRARPARRPRALRARSRRPAPGAVTSPAAHDGQVAVPGAAGGRWAGACDRQASRSHSIVSCRRPSRSHDRLDALAAGRLDDLAGDAADARRRRRGRRRPRPPRRRSRSPASASVADVLSASGCRRPDHGAVARLARRGRRRAARRRGPGARRAGRCPGRPGAARCRRSRDDDRLRLHIVHRSGADRRPPGALVEADAVCVRRAARRRRSARPRAMQATASRARRAGRDARSPGSGPRPRASTRAARLGGAERGGEAGHAGADHEHVGMAVGALEVARAGPSSDHLAEAGDLADQRLGHGPGEASA